MDGRQCQNCRYWERNRVSSTSHGKCKPSAIDVIRPTRAQHRMWLFAQEYVVDSHGTNAAIRAGYAERSAHVMASQLLRNPNVSIWIAEAQELKARSRDNHHRARSGGIPSHSPCTDDGYGHAQGWLGDDSVHRQLDNRAEVGYIANPAEEGR